MFDFDEENEHHYWENPILLESEAFQEILGDLRNGSLRLLTDKDGGNREKIKLIGFIKTLSKTFLYLSPIFITEIVLHYLGITFLIQFDWLAALFESIDVYFLRFILILFELF